MKQIAVIRIKDLLLRTFIGFNPEERINKQDVIINMSIWVDVNGVVNRDNVNNSYDYKKITKSAISLVEEGRFNTLENLTRQILNVIMNDNRVEHAKVEVDKPHALRFAQSVSVELETFKTKK